MSLALVTDSTKQRRKSCKKNAVLSQDLEIAHGDQGRLLVRSYTCAENKCRLRAAYERIVNAPLAGLITHIFPQFYEDAEVCSSTCRLAFTNPKDAHSVSTHCLQILTLQKNKPKSEEGFPKKLHAIEDGYME